MVARGDRIHILDAAVGCCCHLQYRGKRRSGTGGSEGSLERAVHRRQAKPGSDNGWKNHHRIGSAIAQANVGLHVAAGGPWALSRDKCYQLSNRFAWSWKLAALGVPVILIYLGFLGAEEMAPDGALFRSEGDWETTLRGYARGVSDDACWGRRIDVIGTPLRPLIRAIDVPFLPDL